MQKEKIIDIQGEIVGDFGFLNGCFCYVMEESYLAYDDYVKDKDGNKTISKNYIDDLCRELYNCVSGLIKSQRISKDESKFIPRTWSVAKKWDWKQTFEFFIKSINFSLTITFCSIARELQNSIKRFSKNNILFYKEYSYKYAEIQEKRTEIINQKSEPLKAFINGTKFLKFALNNKSSDSYSYVVHRYNPKHTRKENQNKFGKWKLKLDGLLSQITEESVKEELNLLVSCLNYIYRHSGSYSGHLWPSVNGKYYLAYSENQSFNLLYFFERWRIDDQFKRQQNKINKLNKDRKIVFRSYYISQQFNDREYTWLTLKLSFNDWDIKKYRDNNPDWNDEDGLLIVKDSSFSGTYENVYRVVGTYQKWLDIMKGFECKIRLISGCKNKKNIDHTLKEFIKNQSENLISVDNSYNNDSWVDRFLKLF